MSTHLREAWSALVTAGLDGLAEKARQTGTLDAFKTIHEIALGYDELASIADALDLDTVTMPMVQRAHRQIIQVSQAGLRRDGFDAEIPVWRRGELRGVVSVSLTKTATFRDPKPYVVSMDDVLTYGEAVQRGFYAEDELQVDAVRLRPRHVAMPSWRAQGPAFWEDYDAVIATDANGRGRNFEVWTHGKNWATRHSLDAAKQSVEEVYGPLTWRRVRMPPEVYHHYYFGPTTEFTDPTTIYVVDHLPILGARTAAPLPQLPKGWHFSTGGDAISGGYNGYVVLWTDTGEKAGYLDYQTINGYQHWWREDDDYLPLIAMVEVEPKFRRKHVATLLYHQAKRELDVTRMNPGYMTPEGHAWWEGIRMKGWR